MPRLRGEEQDGFLDVLENWLVNQDWFPARTGRRRLARVGGLRLPLPEGLTDPQTTLELHVLDVEHGAMIDRISVPVALRGRPSALAGKDAFIGRLTVADGTERWLYDGAMDHAFLAAWLETVRRGRGSRDGRVRTRAFGDLTERPAFTARLSRSSVHGADGAMTRTLVRPEGVAEAAPRPGDGQVVVEFMRRPASQRDPLRETVLTMADRTTVLPRVLGVVTGAWIDRYAGDDDLDEASVGPADDSPSDGSPPEEPVWEFGDLSIIREATASAPDGAVAAGLALQQGESFASMARRLGQTLGRLHADLAATFGAHPQTTAQMRTNLTGLREELDLARGRASTALREDLVETAQSLDAALADVFEPLPLQRIHGRFSLSEAHVADVDGDWILTEGEESFDHAHTYVDAAAAVVSLAHTAAENAGPDGAEAAAWFDEAFEAFAAGYRDSDADDLGIDSARYRAEVFLRGLPLLLEDEHGRVLAADSLLRHSR
ncbi:MAG: hypothetical protein Q4F53_09630 [Nesterenkonia sp.]|uniref:maltokinase N-terminal cap-like domain-containing protein n=1 Tax=Nesterenkonia marinintestina TaxID=2979865 RepID=UPI0021C103D2|nr:hypothetical protein [Nesterenkonia sp. GX14115]MDO5493852.1 hypothetical protein [Nesterenkonia sp.]